MTMMVTTSMMISSIGKVQAIATTIVVVILTMIIINMHSRQDQGSSYTYVDI